MKAFSLEGHAALVTGSSQGIGQAMGRALQEAGAKVVFPRAEVVHDNRTQIVMTKSVPGGVNEKKVNSVHGLGNLQNCIGAWTGERIYQIPPRTL